MMTEGHSYMAASAICHAADMAKIAWQEAAWERQRPSVLFSPTLTRDGNQWCALYGENLMEGVAGFGDTPAKAMWEFDAAWMNETIPTPSGDNA